MDDKMNDPENEVREETPPQDVDSSSAEISAEISAKIAPQKRLGPFALGVIAGFLADLLVLFLFAWVGSLVSGSNETLKSITDIINGIVFWLVFPVGLGYYLVTKTDKRWFGWGVFFSVYIVAFLGLILLVIAVFIAMIFNLA
jgi:hypothetical protein